MDALISLTSQLKETLFGVNDETAKEEIILEHIKAAEKLNFTTDDFPPDLDWFNTSQPLSRDLLKGKILVLDFFTYCCINCLHIIPHLRQLEENFSVADGLVVLGIHSAKFENEKHSEKILQAIKRLNITHPVVNDKNCYIWNKFQVSCWPTILILGPQRQPLFVLVGEGDKDKLSLLVKVTLKYYKNSISSHSLPLVNCDQIVTSSVLNFPGKIARWENLFAISDSGNHRILIFNSEGQIQFQIGGKTSGFKDGSFNMVRFNSPQGVAFYDSKTIYVADTENHAIRVVDLENFIVRTVVGTGRQGMDYEGGKNGIDQEISSPWDVCIVPCSDFEGSAEIKTNTFQNEILQSPGFDLPPIPSPPPPPPPSPFVTPPHPSSVSSALESSDAEGQVSKGVKGKNEIPPPPGFYLPPISAPSPGIPPPPPPCLVPPPPLSTCAGDSPLPKPSPHLDTDSKVLLIAAAGTHQIWAYFIDSSVWWRRQRYEKIACAAIAGSGKEENRNNSYPMRASFAQPSGLTYSPELQSVFIADAESSTVRKLNLKDGNVSHVVGGTKLPDDLFSYGDVDGKGYDVRLQHPLGIAWSKKGNVLYVCDTYNHKIKKVNVCDGQCLSILKTSDLFNEPGGCCLNESEDMLYVADTNNNCIKMINLSDNSVQKLQLKEQAKHIIGAPLKDDWEVRTCLNKTGGTLTLNITFEPQETHGKWKLGIDESKVQVNSTKGQLENGTLDIVFNFDASEGDDDILEILFELMLCGSEICNFKKLSLKVFVKRTNDADKKLRCTVKKSLL